MILLDGKGKAYRIKRRGINEGQKGNMMSHQGGCIYFVYSLKYSFAVQTKN